MQPPHSVSRLTVALLLIGVIGLAGCSSAAGRAGDSTASGNPASTPSAPAGSTEAPIADTTSDSGWGDVDDVSSETLRNVAGYAFPLRIGNLQLLTMDSAAAAGVTCSIDPFDFLDTFRYLDESAFEALREGQSQYPGDCSDLHPSGWVAAGPDVPGLIEIGLYPNNIGHMSETGSCVVRDMLEPPEIHCDFYSIDDMLVTALAGDDVDARKAFMERFTTVLGKLAPSGRGSDPE